MRRWLLLISLLFALGCPPVLNFNDDDDASADDDVAADDDDTSPQADVWVDPVEVEFGAITIPGLGSAEVTVGNSGTGDLQIEAIVFSNTQVFSLLNGSDFDVVLAPEETTVLVLGFEPAWDGLVSGTMTVSTSDPITPDISVQLSGSGLAGQLEVEPISYDFGATTIGCEQSLEVRVSNVGSPPLYIEGIEFEDVAGHGEMTLHHELDFPLLIGAGIFTVEVRYLPIDLEPDTGNLSVFTDDLGNSPVVVSQYGQGAPGADGSDAWSGDGLQLQYSLSQVPVPDTIEVSVNTVPVYVGWAHDAAQNAILFDAEHVPENGDSIAATYTVWGCVE